MCVTFVSRDLPDHILVGIVRHTSELFIESRVQCHQCRNFGHVESTYNPKYISSRRSGAGLSEAPTAESSRSLISGNDHETFCANAYSGKPDGIFFGFGDLTQLAKEPN